MDIGAYILNILKLFLSWPPMILVLRIIHIKSFKTPISNLLQRITKGKFSGILIEASSTINQQKEVPDPSNQISSQEKIKAYRIQACTL